LVHSFPFPQADIEIISSSNDNPGDGTYKWAYETSDGTQQEQTGELESGPLEDGTDGEYEAVQGSYSYKTPEGRTVMVTYTAGKDVSFNAFLVS